MRARAPLGAIALALCACSKTPMQEADRLRAAGELAGAAAAYQRIAKADPANLAAWDLAVALYCGELAAVGECLGVLDLELELLGKIDRHHDALASALESRARARLEAGLVDPAIADLSRAIQAAPERASVFAALAKAQLARGDRASAERAFDEAKKRDPKLAELGELGTRLAAPGAEDAPFGGP